MAYLAPKWKFSGHFCIFSFKTYCVMDENMLYCKRREPVLKKSGKTRKTHGHEQARRMLHAQETQPL